MASNANVIDELVVKLTLDADDYEKSDKQINVVINKTEKNLIKFDQRGKKAQEAQNKRYKESTKLVKDFGASLGKLALTIGSVLGVGGGVAGLVGAVTALAGFETNLRRASVSTGLSNKELQAWGSAARRLGADAEGGAAALANLAKEQQQFALTGNAPTLAAFQRIGVNAGPNTNIGDILGEAQKRYREASDPQKKQIEAGLSASGVSNDIIVMLKSEKDAREEYNKSLAESTTENKKALDAVSDAMAAVQNAALNLANSIASIAMPYIEQFAKFASDGAQKLSQFADKVAAAGGGLDGLYKVLDRENPNLAENLRTLQSGLTHLGEAVDVIVFGFKQLGAGIGAIGDWINKLTGSNVTGGIGSWLSKSWAELVGDARRESGGGVKLTAGAAARVANGDATGTVPAGAARTSAGASSTRANDLMDMLIARGYDVATAAALVANAEREAGPGLNPQAHNDAGGGQGAHGLFQWRGARLRALRAFAGTDNPSAAQQLDFLTSDPYEQRVLRRAMAGRNGAADIAAGINDRFEVNGVAGEAARRATRAQQLAAQYQPGGAGAAGGTTVALNGPVYVQANNPQEFVSGVTRVSGITNYNSANR